MTRSVCQDQEVRVSCIGWLHKPAHRLLFYAVCVGAGQMKGPFLEWCLDEVFIISVGRCGLVCAPPFGL